VQAFFAPARAKTKEAPPVMTIPLILLAMLALVCGLMAQPLMDFLTPIVGAVL